MSNGGDNGTRVFGGLASPKLTVVCLSFLMALTFWGTVYQVEHGLFAAQERFYNSWLILVGGFVPFPGTQLVMAVLLVNLSLYLAQMVFKPRLKSGILLIHLGILMLLLGGAITHYFAEESQLTLQEGETGSASASYHEWEFALWKQDAGVREVFALDADGAQPGDVLVFGDTGVRVEIEQYHRNARAFQSTVPLTNAPLSRLGVTSLQPAKPAREPAENIAGALVTVRQEGRDPVRAVLFGDDTVPAEFPAGGAGYHLTLRHRRSPLPFIVTLQDFQREMHPGTEVAKRFSSKVQVNTDGVDRTMTISMNKPLRERGYTLYQASYREEPDGTQWSTFAVARNYGRLIPYVSTAVVVLGMIWHFVAMLVKRAGRGTA